MFIILYLIFSLFNVDLIDQLEKCESGSNNMAINLVDRNGKSSYGSFQFQLSSWIFYLNKYKLYDTTGWEEVDYLNNIFDREMQKNIVIKMFEDPQVNLWNEFPICSQKLHLFKNYYVKKI